LVLLYVSTVIYVVTIIPQYGDPGVVLLTAKVVRETGYAYDPVCTKNTDSLCTRSPLYYHLLSFFVIHPWIFTSAILLTFIITQFLLLRLFGSEPSYIGFFFPSIYLLFSRTYVDSLNVLLFTILLIFLLRFKDKNKLNAIFLFTMPLLIILTRESAIAFPVFVTLFLLFNKSVYYSKKVAIMMISGWIVGLLLYYFYIASSFGNGYSDFQLHLPEFLEYYRAIMWFSTPVLPWEVTRSDLEQYLKAIGMYPSIVDAIYVVLYIYLHFAAFLLLLPLIVAIFNCPLNNTIKAQVFFGLIMSGGLLFLKGDLDFYRHTSYLLPTVPGLFNLGLYKLGPKIQLTVKILLISLFVLWVMRQVRLGLIGSSFNACLYVLKRPEISSLEFFLKAACE